MTTELINEPDAPRLINGLRDTGYNFRTAAADIIDNSIAANATKVNIEIELRPDGRKIVYFGDNGNGMSADELYGAMRYGAPERENPESLGKFGLGMKTASSSVCRCFTIISKKSGETELNKLAWDLDHVEKTTLWQMSRDPITDEETESFEELCGEHGTLVVWSKCDRILFKDYDEPGGTKERQAVKRLSNSLKDHVSLIYHRFLDPNDAREREVTISIDGDPVSSWNPFFAERSEQVLTADQQKMEIETEDGEVRVASVKAWILPHRNDLDEAEKAKAKITNRGQGFYIFREGRLISEGGWLGVFGAFNTIEPHMSLLRIEFDFGHELDEAFSIDVKKSRILLDPALSDYLKELLGPARREADLRYRRKEKKKAAAAKVDHTSANNSVASTKNTRAGKVDDANASDQTAVVTNNRGARIKIKSVVQNEVQADSIHVEAVDDITTGDLWEPALRSPNSTDHVPAVLLNKHHDFYQKIYLRAASSGFAVEGMDLLLWALAVAEQNNTNAELDPMFRDIREEVSSNLRKLLRDVPTPSEGDLEE